MLINGVVSHSLGTSAYTMLMSHVKWTWSSMFYFRQWFVVHYNTPMWHFSPCVTFRPCQCHFLDLPMWFVGPEAVPCQWHPPPRIKKIYRNRLKIKRNNINQLQWKQIFEEIPRHKNHDVFRVSSTYSLVNSFHNIWIMNCALSIHATGC